MFVFRGKFLAYMNDAVVKGTVTLPLGMTLQQWKNLRNKLGRKKWDVYVETRYEHGKGVLIYLSRYIRGGAMSNGRIASTTDKAVTFTYKNGDRSKTETMPFTVTEFIQRYLLHIPAPHTKIVRYYGLYATCAPEELALCRSLMGEKPALQEEIIWQSPKNVYPDRCPVCGRPFVHFIEPPNRSEVIPNAA
jgi:hypothetical protein